MRSAVAVLVFSAAARSIAAEGLAQTIDRFEKLSVGAAAPVSDARLTAGRVTLVLKSGSASPVRAGEQIVGLFFSGTGDLEYRSEDAVEAPIFDFNVRKATGLSLERAGTALLVRDGFHSLLWLAPGQPLPPLSGTAPSLDGAFAAHLEKLRRARGLAVSHFFAQQRLDSPDSPRVLAATDGGKESLVYLLDGLEERSESLYVLRKPNFPNSESRKYLYPTVLSDQPVGRDRRDPLPPLYLLTSVDLSLQASGGKEASLSVAETVTPVGQPRRIFRFDLFSTLYGEEMGLRSWRLKSVIDSTGRALAFDHRDGEVLVEALAPVSPDQALQLRFEIEGDFLYRPGGDNYWELGLGGGAWFPQPDLNGQFYDFHCVLKVKKPFVPFASGKTIRRMSDGDENILETRTENPVAFPAVIAGAYQWEEETKNGLTIRVATYAMKNSRAMKQLADLAFGIIQDYERFLGPFPFSEYDIIEINTWGFGQAPPGVLFITKEAFNPLMGETNQLFSQGINERFAHEIAHQWWGQVVKMTSLDEQWLTESFAEYCAALFLKDFKGKSTYNSLLSHWKHNAAQATKIAPIPLANRIAMPSDPETGFIYRTSLVYDKGAYLLAALHKELGDEMFLTFLKSYQKSFRWKFGSTKSVEGLLQWLTKKDYAPYFETNYWGTGMPAD